MSEAVDVRNHAVALDRVQELAHEIRNPLANIKGVKVCLKKSSNGDGEALIEVSDTGCGIPSEIRRQIFEPRFTTKRDGTGLGLAAVRRTANAYHGRITFNTRIGRGTKFVLALPLTNQSPALVSRG